MSRGWPLALACFALTGCSLGAYDDVRDIPDDPAPAGTARHFGLGVLAGRSPYAEGEGSRIFEELRGAIGGGKIACTGVHITPDSVQIEVHQGHGDLNDWWWQNGTIRGPTPVPSVDEQGLTEKVFALSDVPWGDLSRFRLLAKQHLSVEGGRAESTHITRSNSGLRLEVSVRGTRRSANISFDAKGNILGPNGRAIGKIGAAASAAASAEPSFRWNWAPEQALPVLAPDRPTDGAAPSEGFVGLIENRDQPSYPRWVARFEGSKLGMVWKVGPFLSGDDCRPWLHTTVVANDVVFSDCRGTLHVYDLASGREARSLDLPERVKSMCAAPDGSPRVWLQMHDEWVHYKLKDETDLLVDAELGTRKTAARPRWCPATAPGPDCRRSDYADTTPDLSCRSPDIVPKVEGFIPATVVQEGDEAVAFGARYLRRKVRTAIGFDPKSKIVKWQQPLYTGDQLDVVEADYTVDVALSGGRFAAHYLMAADRRPHIVMFDARSGERLWDIATRSPWIQKLRLSPTRLYVVPSSGYFEVYDAKSGGWLGTVGE